MKPEEADSLLEISPGSSDQPLSGAHQFRTTHWSIVLAAGDQHSPLSDQAFDQLCRTYWYPIYAFIRRYGHDPHTAEDLTQNFFTHLLEHHALKSVRPKGKFRSFLLVSVKHFLANEWDRRHAAKRGGEYCFVSLEENQAEERYAGEPSHDSSPERIFEQTWALALLKRVEQRLAEEYGRNGKTALFAALQRRLLGDPDAGAYKELSVQLQMSEAAVRTAAVRLRAHFRESLQKEIAQTVSTPEELQEEFRHLFSLVGR